MKKKIKLQDHLPTIGIILKHKPIKGNRTLLLHRSVEICATAIFKSIHLSVLGRLETFIWKLVHFKTPQVRNTAFCKGITLRCLPTDNV